MDSAAMTPDEQSAKLESIVEYAKKGMALDKDAYISLDRKIIEPLSDQLENTLRSALESAGVAASVWVQIRWRQDRFIISWTAMRTPAQVAQKIHEQYITRGLPYGD